MAVVPYLGYIMDDAAAASESFAKALTSEHIAGCQRNFDHDVKGGLGHFRSLLPQVYAARKMENIDEHEVVKKVTP